MISKDMEIKRNKALDKVWSAIEEHSGQTVLSTGITGDDARLAKAVVDVGIKMLEPNHPALALSKGYHGVVTMNEAEKVRHEVKLSEMTDVVKGIRRVVGDDIFITLGIPGGFTEVKPIRLQQEDFQKVSLSGADSIHTHKSSLNDLKEVVTNAHANGLLVDAYITHPNERGNGIPAETPKDVANIAKEMESMGVDMIGLMTGMTYRGLDASEISDITKERVKALVSSVRVPTLAEGGINVDNYQAFKGTGVNILVIGTSIDQVVQKSAQNLVKKFISK